MQTVQIIIILFKIFPAVFAATEMKIAFLMESSQLSMPASITRSIEQVQQLKSDFKLQPFMFVVNRNANDDFETFCQLMSKQGVSVIFDFTFYAWSVGLDYMRAYNIPYLSFARILSPFMDMFADFMQAKSADDVAIILQNSQDMESALFQLIFGYPFKILLANADDSGFVRRLLDLRPSPSFYAIFANTPNMNKIFEKITNDSLLARPHEWHFIFMDGQEKQFQYEFESEFVTKFSIETKEVCKALQRPSKYCQDDFTFENAVLFSALLNLVEIASSKTDWFEPRFVDCNAKVSSANAAINLTKFYENHNFLKLLNNDNDAPSSFISYKLNVSVDVYGSRVTEDFPLAKWKSGDLKKLNETISAGKRFFRIGVTEIIPWNYYKLNESGAVQYDEKGEIIWEGFCIDLINVLAEKLNFDYVLVEPKQGKFGERDADTNRWDGIVGDLVMGNTEFAVTALKMYAEREEVIDFIAPYFEETGISIVIRKPVKETSLFKFMTVLRLEVWLSIIASLVATAFMLWLLDKYSPYSARNNKAAYPYPCREFTLRESFWFALTSFTPQGGGEIPKAVSGRILVAAYWLFVVLMLATFTANLAAFLTVERMQTPVQSLEQLGRQSRINYTVVADSDTHQYFMNMKFAEDTLYRLWKELALNATLDAHKFRVWDYPIKEQYNAMLFAINTTGPVKTAADGFRKVNEHENADFAFIHDSSEIKYEITRNCNLTEVGEVFAEQPYALAMQQGSVLADEFSYVLLELQKDRYFEELKAKYWNTTKLKACSGDEGNEGITLESLGGVFIATFFGLLLAMIVLAFEVIYYRKPKANIKVKPVAASRPKKKAAWHVSSPPPPFEAVTFRKKAGPSTITLGSQHFKTKRFAINRTNADEANLLAYNEGLRARDKDLPPYVE